MALRHAVLAALLEGEYSGYQLTKVFDLGVANFWYASPQQLYAELAKLEQQGLVAGREVVQESRPNKRLFHVTDAGRAELEAFAEGRLKPSVIRDDLLVMVQAADGIDTEPVIKQLEERAAEAEARIEDLGELLGRIRGDMDEEEFLLRGEGVGGYLTALRGVAFEQGHRDWCLRAMSVLKERRAARAER
ncbi:PadR family transcriptional regulator [Streptomyces sp. NPDC091371]|uniref:PadR family transcriptional regulator n=1 Tax=Streptomyces sp. NPDC091371 TaxID=3155303 RepID=UPI0034312EED